MQGMQDTFVCLICLLEPLSDQRPTACWTVQVAEELMTALDVSGDGQIDHNEFIAACIDHYQLLTDHTLTAIFGEPGLPLHPLCPAVASTRAYACWTSHAGVRYLLCGPRAG